MSQQAFIEFYEASLKKDELKDKLKVITSVQEIIKLGEQHGYFFTTKDIAEASTSAQEEAKTKEPVDLSKNAETKSSEDSTRLYHYEFEFSEIQGFEEIACELEKLKIKPTTVDMDLYNKSFREDDLYFTSLSPDTPEFEQRYDEIMAPCLNSNSIATPDYTQRQFHLVNLDLHVEHPLYDEYFSTKLKILKLLENYFGTDIRFSGSLWYPPNAYRLWHTNEAQPGWRMYLIDFDDFEPLKTEESFFRYMHPDTREIVTLREKSKLVRFFKVEKEPEKLFWHCIVNATRSNRWSFGFVVSDRWMEQLI